MIGEVILDKGQVIEGVSMIGLDLLKYEYPKPSLRLSLTD